MAATGHIQPGVPMGYAGQMRTATRLVLSLTILGFVWAGSSGCASERERNDTAKKERREERRKKRRSVQKRKHEGEVAPKKAPEMPVWTRLRENPNAYAKRTGKPIFVSFTADWCANCKVQEKVVLKTPAVAAAFRATGVVPTYYDLTNNDEKVWEYLEALGRSGIPTYAVYAPDGTVDLLPEVITRSMVVARLKKAATRP